MAYVLVVLFSTPIIKLDPPTICFHDLVLQTITLWDRRATPQERILPQYGFNIFPHTDILSEVQYSSKLGEVLKGLRKGISPNFKRRQFSLEE